MLVRIGTTVILSFLLLFLPFCIALPSHLSVWESLHAVITRMFPWSRWLFEDKVASFWCTLNNVIKLNKVISSERMKQVCLLATLLFSLPTLLLLPKKLTLRNAIYSFFLCSLAFYLFSYHGRKTDEILLWLVHEKTILFPLLPMLMLPTDSADLRQMQLLFELTSSFSMIPLYIKDNNLLPALVLIAVFYVCLMGKEEEIPFTPFPRVNRFIRKGIYTMMVLLVAFYVVPAPSRFPDLHSVFISSFSFCVFFLYYLMVLRLQYNESCEKTKTAWLPHFGAEFSSFRLFVFSQSRTILSMFAIRTASKLPFVGR